MADFFPALPGSRVCSSAEIEYVGSIEPRLDVSLCSGSPTWPHPVLAVGTDKGVNRRTLCTISAHITTQVGPSTRQTPPSPHVPGRHRTAQVSKQTAHPGTHHHPKRAFTLLTRSFLGHFGLVWPTGTSLYPSRWNKHTWNRGHITSPVYINNVKFCMVFTYQ